ncbi:MAG: glyoxylate carboligase, partial [Clostridiales bacterium]|nr:glyoxylate carboligase [Clostridiales bacterium]
CATNFVTGIYSANIDSIPLIAITGQAVRAVMGKDAFQCVDMAAIAKPVAKHTVCLTNPKTAIDEFINCFKVAKEGKPGAVLIDIPLDMQSVEVDFDPDTYVPTTVNNPSASPLAIKAAMDIILEAKNPVIIMGGGVVLANATKELIEFAEIMQIPVVTTYMGKGGIPSDHPLFGGMPGIQCGSPMGNKTFKESDVVLAIGNRFTDRHTGNVAVYTKGKKFIHINVEPKEIGKIFKPDLGIVADAKDAILQLLDAAKKLGSRKGAERVSCLAADRAKLARKVDHDSVPVNPHRVFAELNKAFDDDTMFTTGCGITQIWSGQLQDINKPKRYLASGGAGCLGYDIPGAIGAMRSENCKNKAVAVMGDFGFQFHIQELGTAAANNIPLIVCVVNNAYLGLIRQNQVFGFGYEYGVAMPENQEAIDFVKIAQGFGCEGERVFKPEDIAGAFERAKASKKPYIVDIICDTQAHCSMGADIENIKEWNT